MMRKPGKSTFRGNRRNRLYRLTELAKDLLHPTLDEEKRKHKKKRLVQSPNSYFMDVKCPGCYKITTVFSHAQTVVLCVGCHTVLCQPTGGKARLTEARLARTEEDIFGNRNSFQKLVILLRLFLEVKINLFNDGVYSDSLRYLKEFVVYGL
ncbi:putative 40S ribosomal protein S27-like [Apostichopus japonicus]|uniref:Putative 40S ribosomal protein S27-like n=1 Tax=Stichopus japonicus TaxID=307972 RepID=A0A2G8KF17_STIJA|nr:putative 40S ribosomal protein S27-like [Apostichopus japonicus]